MNATSTAPQAPRLSALLSTLTEVREHPDGFIAACPMHERPNDGSRSVKFLFVVKLRYDNGTANIFPTRCGEGCLPAEIRGHMGLSTYMTHRVVVDRSIDHVEPLAVLKAVN